VRHLSQAGTSSDDVAEALLGSDLVEQVSVLGFESRLIVLQQNPVVISRNITRTYLPPASRIARRLMDVNQVLWATAVR
jgi:hypothetical protein